MSMDAPAARPFALDALEVPLIAAPMAGGPSSPGLAIAVARAGGLGMLAAGYQSAEALAEQIAAVRSGLRDVDRLFGVNVFVAESSPTDPQQLADFRSRWVQAVAALDAEMGEQAAARPLPDYSDDGWDQKIALLVEDPVPVVSFTFGLPPAATIRALQDAGTTVLLSVSSPEEAVEAAAFGPDALVLQGPDAGGHRFTLAQDTAPGTTRCRSCWSRRLRRWRRPIRSCRSSRRAASPSARMRLGCWKRGSRRAGGHPLPRRRGGRHRGGPSGGSAGCGGRSVVGADRGDARVLRSPCSDAVHAVHRGDGRARDRGLPAGQLADVADPQGRGCRGKRELVHLWVGTGFPACRARPAAEIVESFRGL